MWGRKGTLGSKRRQSQLYLYLSKGSFVEGNPLPQVCEFGFIKGREDRVTFYPPGSSRGMQITVTRCPGSDPGRTEWCSPCPPGLHTCRPPQRHRTPVCPTQLVAVTIISAGPELSKSSHRPGLLQHSCGSLAPPASPSLGVEPPTATQAKHWQL